MRLLISWLQSPSAVILQPQNIKSVTVPTVSPSIRHEVMGLDAIILVFWMLSFKPTFSHSSSTGQEEEQAGIKIARRNINNLRYADDTTLMAESKEELKRLLMKVKQNIQKMKTMASGPITSWQINGETMKTVRDFIFLGS